LRRQYDLGVDPLSVLRSLLETIHATTLIKLGAAPDPGHAAEEREALTGWASQLSFAALHRLWQLLLKGHDEVARAALPIEACEMVLLRIVHAATLPDPGELARMLANGAPPVAAPAAPPPAAKPSEAPLPSSIHEIAELLENSAEQALASRLMFHASVVRLSGAELALSALRPLPADFVAELGATLKRLTDRVWKITTEQVAGDPTMREQMEAGADAIKQAVLATPVVRAAFEAFPDAEIQKEEWDRLVSLRSKAS
jgi:DNA polymerase-3 subunit gamma/tau